MVKGEIRERLDKYLQEHLPETHGTRTKAQQRVKTRGWNDGDIAILTGLASAPAHNEKQCVVKGSYFESEDRYLVQCSSGERIYVRPVNLMPPPREAAQPGTIATALPNVEEYCRYGISVDGLLHVLKMFDPPDDTTTSDICHAHVKPATVPDGWIDKAELTNVEKRWYSHQYQNQSLAAADRAWQAQAPNGTRSFCELLEANPATARFVGAPTHFLSHAWSYKFKDVVAGLRAWVSALPDGSQTAYFWFDVFSIDEHATQGFSQEWWGSTFKEAIAKLGHTVMVLSPWSNPIPLTRAWCLWELYCTVETGSRFSVCLSPAERQSFEHAVNDSYAAVMNAFADVDVATSEAGNPDDLTMIMRAVEATDAGCAGINRMVFQQMRGWVKQIAQQVVSDCTMTDGKLVRDDYKLMLVSNIASALDFLGETDESFRLRELNLEATTSLFGPTNPRTLAVKGNLANSLKHLGRSEEARHLLQETIAQKAQVQGATHPDTLREQSQMANTLKDSGRTREAAALYEQTLSAMEQCLGPKSTDALLTKGNYAHALFNLGEHERSFALQEEVVADFSATMGPSHKLTLWFTSRLAFGLTRTADRAGEGAAMLRRVLLKQIEQLGPMHIDTLLSEADLGAHLCTRSESDESVNEGRQLLQEAVDGLSTEYGPRHPLTQQYREQLTRLSREEPGMGGEMNPQMLAQLMAMVEQMPPSQRAALLAQMELS